MLGVVVKQGVQRVEEVLPLGQEIIQELADPLQLAVSTRLQDKGLRLESLHIRDIGFDDTIQEQLDAVWKAQLKHIQARAEACAEAQRLRAISDVVGRENAALVLVAQQPIGAAGLFLQNIFGSSKGFPSLLGSNDDSNSDGDSNSDDNSSV